MAETCLLYGGTFDPVHLGHVVMFRAAFAALSPTATRVIPVGNPWQKGRLPYATAAHRVAMLKLALPEATIDTRELTRSGATYTVDTLREISNEHRRQQVEPPRLIWLLGSDSFAKLDSWHEPVALTALAEFAVVRRAGEALTPPRIPCHFTEIVIAPPPISATAVRARVARGESIADMVPDAVSDYIQQHKLYQP
jgi:nicotinate-nucleotide adenylyltransferase